MTSVLTQKTCTPCRGGVPPLTVEEAEAYRVQAPEWVLREWLIPLSQVVLNMVGLSESAATGAAIDEAADGQAAIAHTTQNGFLFEPRWPGGFACPVCDNVVAASLKSRAVPGEPPNMGGPGTTG